MLTGEDIMGRKKLEWYPGAMYHVTARGNHRSDIFKEEIDFEFYLKCMEEALSYYKDCYRIISYCLMTNHVHIQIEAKEKPISFYIGRINNFYAKNFNKKYNFTGHLFQSRYNAEIIKNDEYVLEVSRYIHLNPVRAKMVDKPSGNRVTGTCKLEDKADHDAMSNSIIQLSGKFENMRKDMAALEVVSARNMENIAELKLVK